MFQFGLLETCPRQHISGNMSLNWWTVLTDNYQRILLRKNSNEPIAGIFPVVQKYSC